MEKNQKKYLIAIVILFGGVVVALGQYLGVFSAIYALAEVPNPGHTWNQMKCNDDFCIKSNMVGIGTYSPESKLHVVGEVNIEGDLKIKGEMIYNSSVSETDRWKFTSPVSVLEPTSPKHAATKKYLMDIFYSNFATCGDEIIDDRLGVDQREIYSTISIGGQCWMAENLRYLPKVTGPEIGGVTPLMYYYVYGYKYDNNKTMSENVLAAKETIDYKNYGVLYSYGAAMSACPEGWRLPTHNDWTNLEIAICTSSSCSNAFPYDVTTKGWRGTDEGIALKGNSFGALMTGYRDSNANDFSTLQNDTYFWTNVPAINSSAWYRYLDSSNSCIERSNLRQSYGFSVRCIKG
jgi:uncharacterized protein (TIGR02145 family)